jgi:hypothetical protein
VFAVERDVNYSLKVKDAIQISAVYLEEIMLLEITDKEKQNFLNTEHS